MDKYDVCIIGGGVLGCLIAHELGRRALSCILTEKNDDLCLGISKANSAILYPGYDHKPGTLKSRLAIEGNVATARACEEFGVPVNRCGSLMAATGERGRAVLQRKYRQGMESKIADLRMLAKEEIREMEPALACSVQTALFSPHTAVINPWLLGIKAAQAARRDGVEIALHTQIIAIRPVEACTGESGPTLLSSGRKNINVLTAPGKGEDEDEVTQSGSTGKGYILTSAAGKEFGAACVINAAGIYADRVRELVFPPRIRIRPSAADYLVYGREENPGLSHVIFYEPEDGGKGVTLVPGTNGAILAGETDRDLPPALLNELTHAFVQRGSMEDILSGVETSAEGLRCLHARIREICPSLDDAQPIRCFAGLRPNPFEVAGDGNGWFGDTGRSIHSFPILRDSQDGSFISLCGMKTPGLTASVPIAEYVASMALEVCRQAGTGRVFMAESTFQDYPEASALQRNRIMSESNPAYGRIICRCEQITEGEIRQAIREGASSVEGVKLRCGAGLGKCQGSRCRSRIAQMLQEAGGYRNASGGMICRENTEETTCEKAEKAVYKPADKKTLYKPAGRTDCDILIVGAGVAGLSLAAALARADASPDILLADREGDAGGILVQCLHAGFPDPDTGKMLDGPAYRDLLWREVSALPGVRTLFRTHITGIREEGAGKHLIYPFVAEAASDGKWIRIQAKQVVLCCGAVERTAGMLQIPGTRPAGVYTAGEVQRMIHLEGKAPGKKAIIVGAGNMGLIVADLMMRSGIEVAVILEKEEKIGASAANVRRYVKDPGSVISEKIFRFSSRPGMICGYPKLEGIRIDGSGEFVPCDTLVIAAGLVPDRQLLYGTGPMPSESQIRLFGNCRQIAPTVSTICRMAQAEAETLQLIMMSASKRPFAHDIASCNREKST